MHLISETGLGIILFFALGIQGIFMLACTGRFLQIKPEGQGLVKVVNCWNTLVLLFFTPVIAVLLMSDHYPALDITRIALSNWLIYGLEILGILLIFYGTGLIVFGFLALRKQFQPGGFSPRPDDSLVTGGIFSIIQHPLYAGVLSMTLGLAFAVQSLFVLALFSIHLILNLQLLPQEEHLLEEKFGIEYQSYSQKVKRLVPYIY
ncbi:methyltransferase family protein [candidate division CSSED10-310 bacterium]|uniref:Methyltransferase family protein n=1 Tax=candidate division CSSED10-310 bacterium TaxID=2855610 RepID=A0ABV6Z453_UNCC1